MKKLAKTTWALIGFAALLVGVWIGEFLLGKDEGGITGAQALAQQSGSFWFWLIAAGAGAFFIVRYALRKYKREGADSGFVHPMLIAAGLMIGLASMKGCEDKANGGVTAPKGRPEAVQVDSNRIAADSLVNMNK